MSRWKLYGKSMLVAAMVGAFCTGVRAEDSEVDVTVITSEKSEFDYIKKYALFEKDVVVVDPQMKIYADIMRITFNEANKAQKIVAQGNVIIIQEDKRARGDVAEYDVELGMVTLTGNPMITMGKNVWAAETITFWRDENRIEGKPRSRLVIYPEGDESHDRLFGEPFRGR